MRLVNPSILLGDRINQSSSFLPHEFKSKIKSKKNKFHSQSYKELKINY